MLNCFLGTAQDQNVDIYCQDPSYLYCIIYSFCGSIMLLQRHFPALRYQQTVQ